jgi:hypothetical protein
MQHNPAIVALVTRLRSKAVFAASRPVPRETLSALIGSDCNFDHLIADIRGELRTRPYELAEVADGYQHRTRPLYGAVIAASGVVAPPAADLSAWSVAEEQRAKVTRAWTEALHHARGVVTLGAIGGLAAHGGDHFGGAGADSHRTQWHATGPSANAGSPEAGAGQRMPFPPFPARQRTGRLGSARSRGAAAISCLVMLLTLSMMFRNALVASSSPQAGTRSAVSSVV